MKNRFIKYIKLTALIAGLTGMMLLTGCGNSKEKNLEKGIEAVMIQDYQSALDTFNQALIDGADIEEVYRGMGLAYMGRGEYTMAISSFKNALSNAGMFPGELEYDINYYMAICYYKIDDYESAISVYDGIIGMKPKDSEAYYLRGSMYLYLNDIDAASLDFDKATELNKNDYRMYIDVYAAMKEHGYEAQGQKYLDTVMATDKDDISEYDKGRLCYYQGEYVQGCNYLERARQQYPADVDITVLLSDCYKKTEQYDYAALIYSTYLTNKQDPEIYNQLGLCYVEQGDYPSALAAFQSGIAIKENNTCIQTLLLNEIVCYENMLDFPTAREKLDAYMSIYPADDTLKKEYAFLTTRL